MSRFDLVLASLVLATHAAAGAWDKEPNAVLGVQLGADINASGLSSCPAADPATACLRSATIPGMRTRHTIEGHPFPYATFAVTVNGDNKIANVSVWMKQNSFQRFVAALNERYGPPTTETSEKVSNLAGAQMDSAKLYWVGRHVTISAMERAGRMDESIVLFTHNQETDKLLDESRRTTKDAAGKL